MNQTLHRARSRSATLATLLQIMLPAFWMGMVIAISFIEAPLKFQAPGITIPLGLGIGRLVFTALNIAELVLLVALTIAVLLPRRASRGMLVTVAALWIITLVKVFVVRPPLNARSDIIVAGGDPGESVLHYLYIGLDLFGVVLLVVALVIAARHLISGRTIQE